MLAYKSAFQLEQKRLGHGNELFIINIPSITTELKALIDEKIVQICHGVKSRSKRQLVKNRISSFLATKDRLTQMGAIAEFFIHLFLNERKFKQQCLFLNLEENSIKKGFDGYYSRQQVQWILESKSGSIDTASISHRAKIKESYDDLKGKLAGKGPNNPWRNAYNHAGHINVAAKRNIVKLIEDFSDEYDINNFHNIADFNIIPGATIFLDGTWTEFDSVKMENKIKSLIATMNYKSIKIICITKISLQIFQDYLVNP
jgi:hypothetical protein